MVSDDCAHRCQRLHPHCTLRITRSVAPDHFWHWRVEMPDGHCYASRGGMSFDDALASMNTEGVEHLRDADQLWREQHADQGAPRDSVADALNGESGPRDERSMDLIAHLRRLRAWSLKTFGPGERTSSLLDHIRKELAEVEREPRDVTEWTDIATLALDGAWRHGYTPEQIARAIETKQTINERERCWPDWRTQPEGRAIEHVRDGE